MKYILSFLVVAEHVYNAYAPLQNTNWTIFHYSSLYISLALIAINSISRFNKVEMWVYLALALGWVVLAIIELSKINMLYREYIVSVNSFQTNTTLTVVILAVLIIGYGTIKKIRRGIYFNINNRFRDTVGQ